MNIEKTLEETKFRKIVLASGLAATAMVVGIVLNANGKSCETAEQRLKNPEKCYQVQGRVVASPEYVKLVKANLMHRDSLYAQQRIKK